MTNETTEVFTLTAAEGNHIIVHSMHPQNGLVPFSTVVPARFYYSSISQFMNQGITPVVFREMLDGISPTWQLWQIITGKDGLRFIYSGDREIVSFLNQPIYDSVKRAQLDLLFKNIFEPSQAALGFIAALRFHIVGREGHILQRLSLIVREQKLILRDLGHSTEELPRTT